MNELSNGKDSTLGNYRELAVEFFAENSPAVKYLDDKIAASRRGADEEVIAPESQVVGLLTQIHLAELYVS